MIHASASDRQSVIIDTHAARVFRLRKGVMTTARLVNDRLKALSVRWRPIMVTLTYADALAWRPEHITDFMRRVHMFAKRRGIKLPYVWVAEMQKRGAVHYHVILWVPARMLFPKADRQGWWVHGSTNICRVKNSVGYVAKYASKFESKDCKYPKGLRLHGIGGITSKEKRIVAWWKLPKDLRQGEEGSCLWRRSPGGGWVNPETGERVLPLMEMGGHSENWRMVEMRPSSLTEEERTWRSYYKEDQAVRRVLVLESRPAKIEMWDQRLANQKELNRQWLGAISRQATDLLEDLNALLEEDRVRWVWRIEALARTSPDA